MSGKISMVLVLFLMSLSHLRAQPDPPNEERKVGKVVSSLRLGVASPTAASLGKYGDIPVNLYTGTPNISIPLYSGNSRKLSLPGKLSRPETGLLFGMRISVKQIKSNINFLTSI